MIIERGYKFNIWCYSRVDTVRDHYLDTLKKAGVNWLALGIESGNTRVRKDVTKGRFEDVDIRSVVKKIRDHGINVIGNYIFGLPEDDMESMQMTLDLAMEMNQRLDGKWVTTPQDEILQQKFKSLFHTDPHCYGFPSRIGAQFLRENKDLLD